MICPRCITTTTTHPNPLNEFVYLFNFHTFYGGISNANFDFIKEICNMQEKKNKNQKKCNKKKLKKLKYHNTLSKV